jgi:hypothetical protein
MTTAGTDPTTTLRAILDAVAQGGDHFAVLLLQAGASPTEVRDQYFRLAKQVHPDLPAFLQDATARADASKAFAAITVAHATLADPAKRAAWQADQQASRNARVVDAITAPVPATTPSGRMPAAVTPETAKVYLARGKYALQRRDWQVAQDALNLAVRALEGTELLDAQLGLGWAVFNNVANPEAERIQRPRELWLAVIGGAGKSPLAAQGNYYLAVWNKLHGDMREASKHVEACLAVDPRHIDAQREKMLLERRRSGSVTQPVMRIDGKTGDRRPSSTSVPVAAPQKIALKKEPSFFERLFGSKKS